MYPEKKIVTLWLEQKGFLVINNLNAGSRVIDALAIRTDQNKPVEIKHVEVSCSVAKQPEDIASVTKKFNDPNVIKTIRKILKDRFGALQSYDKLLVTTSPTLIPDIATLTFETVLYEVINNLDQQNYNDPTLRTLQIFKYIYIASPEIMARTLSSEDKTLSRFAKKAILKQLLKDPITKKMLQSKSFQPQMVEIIKDSNLAAPETLADQLHKNILKQRSKKKFLNEFLNHKEAGQLVPKHIRTQKKLQQFLPKRG